MKQDKSRRLQKPAVKRNVRSAESLWQTGSFWRGEGRQKIVPDAFALGRGHEKAQEHCSLLVVNWYLVRIMGICKFFLKN